MKATIPYIQNKFDEFNRLFFQGKLPAIPIKLSDAKTFLGYCACKVLRDRSGRKVCYDFKLSINARIDLPEKKLEDTIIHEMIHYYIGYNNIEDTSLHGKVFKQIMTTINERYGRNVTISNKATIEEKEQSVDKKARWHVVAIVKFNNGRYGIKVLPRIQQRIVYYYNMVSSSAEVAHIELYMSNNIFFNRFPNSSKLNVHYLDKDVIDANVLGASRLICNGVSVIIQK